VACEEEKKRQGTCSRRGKKGLPKETRRGNKLGGKYQGFDQYGKKLSESSEEEEKKERGVGDSKPEKGTIANTVW